MRLMADLDTISRGICYVPLGLYVAGNRDAGFGRCSVDCTAAKNAKNVHTQTPAFEDKMKEGKISLQERKRSKREELPHFFVLGLYLRPSDQSGRSRHRHLCRNRDKISK